MGKQTWGKAHQVRDVYMRNFTMSIRDKIPDELWHKNGRLFWEVSEGQLWSGRSEDTQFCKWTGKRNYQAAWGFHTSVYPRETGDHQEVHFLCTGNVVFPANIIANPVRYAVLRYRVRGHLAAHYPTFWWHVQKILAGGENETTDWSRWAIHHWAGRFSHIRGIKDEHFQHEILLQTQRRGGKTPSPGSLTLCEDGGEGGLTMSLPTGGFSLYTDDANEK